MQEKRNLEVEDLKRKDFLNVLMICGILAAFIVSSIVMSWMNSDRGSFAAVQAAEATEETSSVETKQAVVAEVDLKEFLEDLGAYEVHFSSVNCTFEINGFKGQFRRIEEVGQVALYFSEDGEQFIPAINEKRDDPDARVIYYDADRNMYLTDTQVRAIDYVAFRGDYLFQNGDGSYFSVEENIRIWVLGEEPESYNFD